MTHPILKQRIRTVLKVIDLRGMGMPRFREDHHDLYVLERTRCAPEIARYVPRFRGPACLPADAEIAAGQVRLT